MHLLAHSAFLFIGISLGLIGGGGSILTVPVLVSLRLSGLKFSNGRNGSNMYGYVSIYAKSYHSKNG
ncbi:hypothetical protein SNE26_20600 [Mucilaginibacter sp. cycad4]|uniref:hypothetical protein n=1 Tax=Mucilaginibacter sp. cycad4 TaxID=3342096 RepID=UPI002AAB2780|nr:hypothetical protein [Mucilaginibacter gossypii]WPU98429.1 hypothetical protein SNE26_20600 [Mucilaginibacter gossypii]